MSTTDEHTRRDPRRDPLTLAAAGAVVAAAIGAALPWFAPLASSTRTGSPGLVLPHAFCWQAARLGFLAPLAIVVLGVAVLGPRLRLVARDQPPRPPRRDGLMLAGAGGVAVAVLVLVWVLLSKSYSVAGVSWDALASAGYRFDRRPQPGYLITAIAAVVVLLCGVLLVLQGRRDARRETRADDDGDGAGGGAGIIT